jgi:hypothetical protein
LSLYVMSRHRGSLLFGDWHGMSSICFVLRRRQVLEKGEGDGVSFPEWLIDMVLTSVVIVIVLLAIKVLSRA